MTKPNLSVAAIIAALFPKSEKAISEKLSQDEFNAFSADAQEVQDRLDAQATGNKAVADDLTTANANLAVAQEQLTTAQNDLATAQSELATANTTIKSLSAKAAQWDAYKASLNGANLQNDSTNGQQAEQGEPKETARQTRLRELKAKHPRMMEGIDVSDDE